MDAVSFVLGVRTAQLRGNLRDLLYNNTDLGESFERPRRGAVKLLFQPDKGEAVEFRRHNVTSGGENFSSQFRIDGCNVGWDAYNE
jgi:structural maintenance of chromosome 1